MKMKRRATKTGFTLIELLAVIVILAIIALIAVPVILNIIDKANKSAFKDSAYGVIQAAEYYYAASQLDLEGPMNDVKMKTNDSRLEIKGDIPDGDVIITRTGDIAIAVKNDRYCATKDYSSDDVLISENVEKCAIPKRLSDIATISEKLEIDEVNACMSKGQICSVSKDNSVSFAIKVNEEDTYKFYVLKDDGEKVTLIMDRNLGDGVAWISPDDYATENKDDTSCGYNSCVDEGPITAVATLKERTSGWTNIVERQYTYSDDGGGNRYATFTKIMRARILTYSEAITDLGCKLYVEGSDDSPKSCPNYLYTNLSEDTEDEYPYGYWLSATHSQNIFLGHSVDFSGGVGYHNTHYDTNFGIRPVIELSK